MDNLAFLTDGLFVDCVDTGDCPECPPQTPYYNGCIDVNTITTTITETYEGCDILTTNIGTIILESEDAISVSNAITNTTVVKEHI